MHALLSLLNTDPCYMRFASYNDELNIPCRNYVGDKHHDTLE